MEQGGRRPPAVRWRPSRGAAILGSVGLLAGLAAGYAAGNRQAAAGARASQSSPAPASSAPASSAPAVASSAPPGIPVSDALTQTISACSAQVGRELQLGVQVTNQSRVAVTLHRVKAVLPLGGLRAIAQRWAPCGAIQVGQDQQASLLAPGASTWFTVTFKVLTGCPGPFPVQFTVDYDWHGQPSAVSLPGFSDLSEVPYTGCSAN